MLERSGANYLTTVARSGLEVLQGAPMQQERQARYCFYPWERFTTEPANSILLFKVLEQVYSGPNRLSSK
jgi:hypothetical protein